MNRFLSASLLATFGFLASCNDDKEPDYPIEPYIESADLNFVEVAGFQEPDTLNLSFYFRDGDMDLGMDYKSNSDLDSPYHYMNLYLQDDSQLVKIATNSESIDFDYDLYTNNLSSISVNSRKGKLATVRTRKVSGFEYLPVFSKGDCTDYDYFYVLVDEKDKSAFDESYTIAKTFQSAENTTQYVLIDTFYYEINPNHYNITIDYLVKQTDGSFIEFDWRKEYCLTFDGRFPPIKGIRKGMTIMSGPFKIKGYSSKDGILRYSINSVGFKMLFGGKTIKLRVKIKDRALHDSNIIETNEIQI